MESQEGWKWYGYAGHFIGGKKCAFHLATRVGSYLVSTVGDYRPDGQSRETVGSGPEDFFETFVFECDGEDSDGNPSIANWSSIDCKRYEDSLVAEQGHYEFCHRYAKVSQQSQPRKD